MLIARLSVRTSDWCTVLVLIGVLGFAVISNGDETVAKIAATLRLQQPKLQLPSRSIRYTLFLFTISYY